MLPAHPRLPLAPVNELNHVVLVYRLQRGRVEEADLQQVRHGPLVVQQLVRGDVVDLLGLRIRAGAGATDAGAPKGEGRGWAGATTMRAHTRCSLWRGNSISRQTSVERSSWMSTLILSYEARNSITNSSCADPCRCSLAWRRKYRRARGRGPSDARSHMRP